MTLQLVGTECSECGERLRSDRGAGGCLECEATFHSKCTEGTACPSCGADWRALWEDAEKEQQRDRATMDAAERRRGRNRSSARALVIGGASLALGSFVVRGADPALALFKLGMLGVGGLVSVVGLAVYFLNRSSRF